MGGVVVVHISFLPLGLQNLDYLLSGSLWKKFTDPQEHSKITMYYRELADVVIPGTRISITYTHDFSQKVLTDLCSSLFLYTSVQSPYQNSIYWKNFQISPSIPIQVTLRILNSEAPVKTEWGPNYHAHPTVP